MEQHHNRRLNRQDYKTLTLAALGGALEFYDFIIFVFSRRVILLARLAELLWRTLVTKLAVRNCSNSVYC